MGAEKLAKAITLAQRADNLIGESGLLYEFAAELGEDSEVADELVEGLLTRGAMGVMYGDSNVGKTFVAIDVAASIARGVRWMGRNVEPGMVLYLAAESPHSVRMRIRAYQKHHNIKVQNFAIVRSPIDLFNGNTNADAVIGLVRKLEKRQGVKCELIVGDTLSRLAAGANENSGEDMSTVVRHVDTIRQECNAHFLLIHHCGKDAAKGARGWSGLRAATDTEIEITADAVTGLHAAEITKQRDIPGKGDRTGFRLEPVAMGLSKWGSPLTSCVVVPADAPAKQSTSKRVSEIGGAIIETLTQRGAGMRKRELAKHFEDRYTPSCVYREVKKMTDTRKLTEVAGVVALA
jgi:putative DNA primase/helicase